ncbi:MAG: alpha/beta fold hydrolase, partial [Pseudomonadota bacterium]
ALIYAISHPERVTNLVLRSTFLMTKAELDWFYGGGAGLFWPDVWRQFVEMIPENERDDLIKAYSNRLFTGDLASETRYARSWASWENTLASIRNDGPVGDSPAEFARAFARLENHYFSNLGFLDSDGWIEQNLDKIAEIPGTVVQGRYDMICPPVTAYRLTEKWRSGKLRLIPRAGHALSEPGITAELVRTTDALKLNA